MKVSRQLVANSTEVKIFVIVMVCFMFVSCVAELSDRAVAKRRNNASEFIGLLNVSLRKIELELQEEPDDGSNAESGSSNPVTKSEPR